jgi:lipopolysaccharide export system permease protein
MRGQVNPIITMAQSGSMTAHINKMLVNIVLKNGSLHRPDGKRSQIISFDSYVINIPLQTPTIFDGKDVTQMSSGSMTMTQLQESATLLGRDSIDGKKHLVHYHKRLTLPVGCFILSLLGMPLGLLAGPGRKAVGIPLGLAFFILYYILFTLGKTLAFDTQVPIFLAMWLPNTIFLLIALYFIRQSSRELPVIPDAFKNKFSRLLDSVFAPSIKKIKRLFPISKSKSAPVIDSGESPPQPISPQKLVPNRERPTYLTEGTVHGNVNSHIFHLQGCDSYYCKNCTIEFQDIKLAKESGFEPCPFCKTLVEDASKDTH